MRTKALNNGCINKEPIEQKKEKTPIAFWRRYIWLLLRYGTLKKFFNLSRSLYYYYKAAENIPTMPAFLKVEVSRKCHVQCKFCPAKKDSVFYPLTDFVRLIDRLKDHIFLVSLYDIGEPLYNDDLLDYINYAHKKNVGTVISSSLSLQMTDEFWEKLVSSGLDKLIVAIDGITAQVYNSYRTNGDLKLVMNNLKKIMHYKKQCRNKLIVEWQMIDLILNKPEHLAAEKLAKQLGCDYFRIIPEATQARSKYKEKNIIRKTNCLLPYIIFIVDAFRRVRPCYKIYTDDVFISKKGNDNFDKTWNCQEIARIRNKNKIKDRTPCRTCME